MKRAVKTTLRLTLMVIVAITAGAGIAYASANLSGTSNGSSNADTFDLQAGNDVIKLGAGQDHLDFGSGVNFIFMDGLQNNGPQESQVIVFSDWFHPNGDWLIWREGDDDQVLTDDQTELRWDSILLTATSGDVIIRLGN